jgi:hypothetical protein
MTNTELLAEIDDLLDDATTAWRSSQQNIRPSHDGNRFIGGKYSTECRQHYHAMECLGLIADAAGQAFYCGNNTALNRLHCAANMIRKPTTTARWLLNPMRYTQKPPMPKRRYDMPSKGFKYNYKDHTIHVYQISWTPSYWDSKITCKHGHRWWSQRASTPQFATEYAEKSIEEHIQDCP